MRKAVLSALALSPRIFLHASGTAAPPLPEGGLALSILLSTAFGDGSHPTTRLIAGALDLLCRQRAPQSVLDVGTGTGVLARIARARGARFVVGTDIDPIALESAQAHAALDNHPVDILISNRAPDSWGPRFDLVLANILEAPLRDLAPSLRDALVPGGKLLISGFTPIQIPALRVTYSALGFRDFIEARLDGWALLMAAR